VGVARKRAKRQLDGTYILSDEWKMQGFFDIIIDGA
jgi:hypothetical protein